MLACAGASVWQRRFFVICEGVILGIIGIPLGLILGSVSVSAILPEVEKALEMRTGITVQSNFYWNPQIIFIIIILGFLIIALAVFVPSVNAGKVSLLEYIYRFRNTISSQKNFYIFQKNKKIEINLAKKNLSYTKPQTLITIGLLMFAFIIALNGYIFIKIQNGDYLLQDRRRQKALDSWITIYSDDLTIGNNVKKEFSNVLGVRDITYASELNLGAVIFPGQNIDKDLDGFTFYGLVGRNPVEFINDKKLEHKRYAFNTRVVGIEESIFIEYAQDCNYDLDNASDLQYPVIIEDYIPIKKDGDTKQSYRSVLDIKGGEVVSVEYGSYADYVLLDNSIYCNEKQKMNFKVIGVTEKPVPLPQTPEEYVSKTDGYSQLEDSYLTLYMPYDCFKNFIQDSRVKKRMSQCRKT